MLSVTFTPDAFDDYNQWAVTDKQLFKRLINIITECQREPFKGIGKPEALKHQLKGYWSRRINEEHRLVYKVLSDNIVIISCKNHY